MKNKLSSVVTKLEPFLQEIKFLALREVRILRLAIKGFNEDKVQLRASALTYYTMLSIVPIIAMVFGIAKGFGFENRLQNEIAKSFTGQEEVLNWVLNFAEKYLANVKGGFIAGIGVVILIWTVIKLMGNIESSFNDIWQIKKSRVISRKLSDYISLIVIAPILIFLSGSVTIFLTEQVKSSEQALPLLGYIGPLLHIFVTLIPYILIWLVMTLLFLIMPNTKVNFTAAFIGGVIAGTMFQLLQWGYIHFQSMLTSYGAVYGSFAALPLFMIWLQLSWLIVLFGAEVSFSHQNIKHYEAESESENISQRIRKSVALLVLNKITLRFKNGEPAFTAEDIANQLDLSVRLVRDVLYDMLEAGIVTETVTKNIKENAFQPAQDIERLTVALVLEKLDKRGREDLIMNDTSEIKKTIHIIDSVNKDIVKSASNKKVVDLV